MKESVSVYVIVGGMLVDVAAVMGAAYHVQRYVAGNFVVIIINASLHATEVLVLLVH